MNVLDFYRMKENKEKISVMTCYDYTSARILSQTSIDCLLVGDSVAMTMHGFKDTLSATVEMMCMHIEAVSRGAGDKFIIGDMPFLSYRQSQSKSVSNAMHLMRAGAQALKLEGANGNLKLIKHLVESGVPVMGHLGLTPQSVNLLGGYKVQGKTQAGADRLLDDACKLQEAGCFGVVLECIPAVLAKKITASISIPTIGIGAGSHTDGQVLVYQDLLGMNLDLQPKFVKRFIDGKEQIFNGVEAYINSVKNGEFPLYEHSF